MQIHAATSAMFGFVLLAACAEPAVNAADPPHSSATPLVRAGQSAELQWGPCPEIFPAGCEIAVLHGDPAQPNADIFLRVPAGYQIPAHSHTSAERMVLVSGEMNVHYQGTPASAWRTGEYAYGPPEIPHDASCVSSDPCTLFIAFEGPVDATAYNGEIN